MEVSTSDDVIQLMKSAPTVDGGSVTFADSAMEAQEQADKAAYLGDITGFVLILLSVPSSPTALWSAVTHCPLECSGVHEQVLQEGEVLD